MSRYAGVSALPSRTLRKEQVCEAPSRGRSAGEDSLTGSLTRGLDVSDDRSKRRGSSSGGGVEAAPLSRAVIALLAVGLVLLAVFGPGSFEQRAPVVGTALALLTIVLALASRRRLDLFDPALPAVAVLGVLFVLRPLHMLSTHDFNADGFDTEAGFDGTAWLAFGACWAYAIGFLGAAMPRARSESTPARRLPPAPTVAVVVAGCGAGLFLLNLQIHGGIRSGLENLAAGRSLASIQIVTDSTQYLTVAPALLTVACVLLLLRYPTKLPTRLGILIIVFTALAVGAFSLTGSRRFIIPAVAIPAALFYVLRRRRPKGRYVLLIGVASFAMLAVIPAIRAQGAKQEGATFTSGLATTVRAPYKTVDQFLADDDTEMFAVLTLEREYYAEGGQHSDGKATFGDLVLAPIPSTLFPGKPTTARNELLEHLYGAPCRTVASGLCPDFSAIGTFYQDAGFIGALLGMAAMGVFTASMRRRLIDVSDPGKMALPVAWLVFQPIIIRAGVDPALTWLLFFTVPAWLAVRFFGRRVDRTGAAAAGASGPPRRRVAGGERATA